MQDEVAQSKTERDQFTDRLRLCVKKKLKMFSIFSMTKRYSRYRWYIGTFHVYKKVKLYVAKRLDKLSYITDNLRKMYPLDTLIVVTKERTRDGFPHYHFLIGFLKDEWGITPELCSIRNTKLWVKEWTLGESFSFHDNIEIKTYEDEEVKYSYLPCFHYVVVSTLRPVDMGAKQRWFRYGILCYFKYIFKYSDLNLYTDYFVRW